MRHVYSLNSQYLLVHDLLLSEILLLLLLQDAVLFCNDPCCRVHRNLTDAAQSLLIGADRPHAIQTQFPADLVPHLADLDNHHLSVHTVSVSSETKARCDEITPSLCPPVHSYRLSSPFRDSHLIQFNI